MDYEELPFVSCIRVGNRQILPPLMTDDRRAEMRYYRELAVTLEKHYELRTTTRRSFDSGVVISGSEGSIGKKATETIESDIVDVNDSYTTTDGFSPECELPARKRRDSFTLEAPSPIMLQFMKANEKYDELIIEMMDSSDSSTVVNEEIPMSIPVEEFSTDGIILQSEKLTLQDLEGNSDMENSSKIWDTSECSFGCNDIKQFVANAKRAKAFSLPDTSNASPVYLPKTSASSCCLMNHYDSKRPANFSKNEDPFIELPENQPYINDNFSKFAESFDLNNSVNMSLESEVCGRESMFSNCSSVSLNKFFVDMKLTDSEESTALNNYLHLKDQLELKHRNELMKLLREQQKENSLLDQLIRVSNTSSPKSNYAYSKDIVLKKYSAGNSPSPIFSKDSSDRNTIQRPNRILSCRRRICDDEPKKPTLVNSSDVPVMMTVNNEANVESFQDVETRVRAATKITAAVRGYFVRRLFKTSRVQTLLQTINDCLITAISLQKESDLKPAELSLQSRVLQQSITAQNEILEVFALPTSKQLEIIAADRELKNRSSLRKNRTPLPLSEATQKTIERRKSLNCGTQTLQNAVRKRCKSMSSVRSGKGSNTKCQNAVNTGKTRTQLSQNYSVPRYTRSSWR